MPVDAQAPDRSPRSASGFESQRQAADGCDRQRRLMRQEARGPFPDVHVTFHFQLATLNLSFCFAHLIFPTAVSTTP